MDDEIQINVPNEPPMFSVVLDAEGFAWQRHGRAWARSSDSTHVRYSTYDWTGLLLNRGKVRIIHYAPASALDI